MGCTLRSAGSPCTSPSVRGALGDLALARAEEMSAAGPPRDTSAPWGAATRAAAERGGKWEAMGKCSPDTALRDINDLLERGVLARLEGVDGVRGICWSNRALQLMQ